tara:strand:+ start:373 stop:573 length:201 start_codon:yes stop_codon:yes gene_type:complete
MSGRSIRSIRRIRGGDINAPAWNSGGIPQSGIGLNSNNKRATNVWRRSHFLVVFTNQAQVAMRKNV